MKLSCVHLRTDVADAFCWKQEAGFRFTVIGCYLLLCSLQACDDYDDDFISVVQQMWKMDVPSKISMFGGRLLQNRLPARVELWSRGFIRDVHQICCVFCFDEIETACHLFTSCSKTRMILDWTCNNEYYNQYNSFFVQVEISLCSLTF
jgi:hypothetical protein